MAKKGKSDLRAKRSGTPKTPDQVLEFIADAVNEHVTLEDEITDVNAAVNALQGGQSEEHDDIEDEDDVRDMVDRLDLGELINQTKGNLERLEAAQKLYLSRRVDIVNQALEQLSQCPHCGKHFNALGVM